MLKSSWTAAAAAAVLAGVLVAVAPDPPSVRDGDALLLVGRDGDQPDGPLHFVLEGKPVRGLYPGAVKQMKITVRNPLGFRISLQRLTATVSSSSRRGCPATAGNLRVREYSGRLPATVAATGRTELDGSIPIVMPVNASEKCAGADFTITVSGVGHRMSR
ncbi:hypothetical protein [Actinoplanes aureus]|uniref:Uncharacterized protein n=1 Tax=Actinoplanes aureus TaxID=2792083 RepID=A0A931C764_9ACTN|nr:hypothetical protein [Actinoplanes aureus]MBG0561728.1 hypothetical protein [Actinoplanes aureus]